MNVNITAVLTSEEFNTLHSLLGDYKRITRDQYYRFVKTEYVYSNDEHNKEKYEEAQSIYKKIVEQNSK